MCNVCFLDSYGSMPYYSKQFGNGLASCNTVHVRYMADAVLRINEARQGIH